MICLVSVSSIEMYNGDQNRDSRDPSLEWGRQLKASTGRAQVLLGGILGNWCWHLPPGFGFCPWCPSLQNVSSGSFYSELGNVVGFHLPAGWHCPRPALQPPWAPWNRSSCWPQPSPCSIWYKNPWTSAPAIALNDDVVEPVSILCGPDQWAAST